MDARSAIRGGIFRSLVVAGISPMLLLSALPAAGCCCATGKTISIGVHLLSALGNGDLKSYCQCDECPAKLKTGPCCCAARVVPSQPHSAGRSCIQSQSERCQLIVQDSLLLASAKPVIETEAIAAPQIELVLQDVTQLRASTVEFEWNTGPPPVDLVVSLRRLLI